MSGITACLLILALSVQPSAAADSAATAPGDEARRTVDGFHASLLAVMKQADRTGIEERYKILEPEIANRFDLRLMIALASGKYWRDAGDDARDKLATAFQRFSTATYASRFSGWSGQSFRTRGVKSGPRRTELVSTEIIRPDAPPVALTYVTRAVKGGWRIVDVLVDDGISELAVRRSEYQAVLKSDGIPGLIALLDRNTEKLLRQ